MHVFYKLSWSTWIEYASCWMLMGVSIGQTFPILIIQDNAITMDKRRRKSLLFRLLSESISRTSPVSFCDVWDSDHRGGGISIQVWGKHGCYSLPKFQLHQPWIPSFIWGNFFLFQQSVPSIFPNGWSWQNPSSWILSSFHHQPCLPWLHWPWPFLLFSAWKSMFRISC